MGLFARPRGPWLGIDIGSAALKVACVAAGRGGPALVAFASAPTPPGSVAGGAVAAPEQVGEALASLLGESGIPRRPAALALGGEAALVREVSFPAMPRHELDRAVAYEVERYIAGGSSGAARDYCVTGQRDGRVDVLLVAARRETLDRHVAPLRAAGVRPAAVEASCLALLRALWTCGDGGPDEARAYIDIGESGTEIVIAEGPAPRLARHVAVGGGALTRAVADSLRVDIETARGLKERVGRAPAPGDASGSAEADAVAAALLPVLAQIATEVRRSLDFYHQRAQGKRVSLAVIAGGTARLPRLDAFLSAELGIPVSVASPLSAVAAAPGVDPARAVDEGPALAVALGLALRGAGR